MGTHSPSLTLENATPSGSARIPHLHGDLAIWIFILAELLVFGVFFAAYAFARANNIELFDAEQAALNRNAGAAGAGRLSARWLLGAMACGGGFVVIKLWEYTAQFGAGVSLSSSTFHMFYISLTFFHFMHVLLGMVILGALWNNARQGRYDADNMNGIESGAAYWHMVDLVWLILFPLVYVMR